MKTTKTTLLILLIGMIFGPFNGYITTLYAQAPEGFKYQAAIRDATGNAMANQAVNLRISIREDNSTGNVVYQETFSATTNQFGLINLSIGMGIPVIGSFGTLEWDSHNYYIQVEVNPGTGYVNMGTMQLLSVPYALHAKTAEYVTITETDPVFMSSPSGAITLSDITNWNNAYGWGNHLTQGYLTANQNITLTGDITGNGSTSIPTSIAPNAVNTAHIAVNAVTSSKIAPNSVDNSHLINNAITTPKIADNSVTSSKISDNSVTALKIANNSVNSMHIIDNSITSSKIASDAVTTAKIAANAVNNLNIADNAISTSKIDNNAVTGAKIAVNAVNNINIVDYSITASKIDYNAVTGVKIAANSVYNHHIADSAITSSKIASNAVTVSQLPAGATASGFLRGDGTWAIPASSASSLDQVLAAGNSTGVYDINMNGNSLTNADVIQMSLSSGSYFSMGHGSLKDYNSYSGTIGQVLTVNTAGGVIWSTPSTGITGSGSSNYVPRFTSNSSIGTSAIMSDGVNVAIEGSVSNLYKLYVNPSTLNSAVIRIPNTGSNMDGIYITSSNASLTYAPIYVNQQNPSGRAAFFNGDVHINGTLSKSNGSFLIDHPDDPLNKTLRHNFVESPENLCLYRGTVDINANGKGNVQMPGYFAGLTREDEATVILTPVGKPFPLGYEWNEDHTGITVFGDPGRTASYLVMADRDDPVIKLLNKPVVENKADGHEIPAGKMFHPKAYGYSEEYSIDYEKTQREEEEAVAAKARQTDPPVLYFDESGQLVPQQLINEFIAAGYPLYTAEQAEQRRVDAFRVKLDNYKQCRETK